MRLATVLATAATLSACIAHDPPGSDAAVLAEAHALIDARYALFGDKQVDWAGALTRAEDRLFVRGDPLEPVLIGMLDELEDGHVNLETPTQVSWATAFLEDRVPTWNEDLVQRHVLGFDFRRQGTLMWAEPRPPERPWGYLRVDSLSSLPSPTTLDAVFASMAEAPGLILDLRSNGGGRLERAGQLLGRFLGEPLDAWHLQVSTGPAHSDLSAPVPRPVSPAEPGYDGPLAVLVDGRTYSAAHLVAVVLEARPGTGIVGAETGGGAGSPTWHELANGWGLRFPTIRLTGPEQEAIEVGLPVQVPAEPDPTRPEADAMIEAAAGWLP